MQITEFTKIQEQAAKGFNVVPVKMSVTTDQLPPIYVFEHLYNQGKAQCLLESIRSGLVSHRYVYMGVDPVAKLRIKNGKTVLEKKGQTTVLEGAPFKAMEAYLGQFNAEADPHMPPFAGGAIGYVSYDAIAHLENINLPEPSEDTPDETCLLIFKTLLTFDHQEQTYHLIHNIFTDEETLEEGYANAQQKLADLQKAFLDVPLRMPPALTIEDAPLPELKAAMGKEKFESNVLKIKEAIHEGEVFQCVLSDQFSFPLTVSPMEVYRVLRESNPSPYMFFIDTGAECVLGASPEMLVQVLDGVVETCPIAGTRKRGTNLAEDQALEAELLSDAKELAEHTMLIDLGRNDIGRVAKAGTVDVPRLMGIERFSHVMHIVSTVTGDLHDDISPEMALAAGFPAGTLTGAPKISAMKLISKYESVRRGVYGGGVMFRSFNGNMTSCITIRTMVAKNGKGFVQAGAGVVADSVPHKEYEEVQNKAKSCLRAAAIAMAQAKQKQGATS